MESWTGDIVPASGGTYPFTVVFRNGPSVIKVVPVTSREEGEAEIALTLKRSDAEASDA